MAWLVSQSLRRLVSPGCDDAGAGLSYPTGRWAAYAVQHELQRQHARGSEMGLASAKTVEGASGASDHLQRGPLGQN